MRNRLKIFFLLTLVASGIILVSFQFEPVKAATRRVVYGLKFTDGLIGYWSFDGAYLSGTTATDRSGNLNTGTITSGQVVAEGVVGQGLNFDGVDDYVSTANSLANPQNFSVSFWFKTATASGHKIVGFENAQTGTGGANYDRQIYIGTDGKIYFGWYSGSLNLITSTDALNDDRWHHVVGTHTSGGGGVLYVDGVSQGTAANDAESYTGYWRIGSYKLASWTNASDGYYAGQIDEVRIYNRSLSSAEQAYIYNRTKSAGSGTTAKSVANNNGLVGYWDFDDCDTCTTVADRSDNGNTGTMYNDGAGGVLNLRTASSSTSGFTGKMGGGALFDGSDDYVDLGTGLNSAINSSQFTMSFYLYVKKTQDSLLIGRRGGASSRAIGYNIWSAGGISTVEETIAIIQSVPYSDKLLGWHHIAWTYGESSNASKLYIDGVLVSNVSYVFTANTTSNLYLSEGLISNSLDGLMDEVRVYNRALSAAEIKNLYASTQKSFINMPQNNFIKDGLVGNWSFNGQDMSGVTAIDRGAGGNNGTLTGGPVVTEGIVGQALSLDGVNDYVTIADHATLDIASAITISAWIRHASNTFKDWEAIVTKGDSAYRLHLCGNTSFCGGTPTDDAINATFTGTSCSNNSVTSTVVPALNKWYHVVTTYEGSAIKIYIDGALNAEVGCTGSITTNGFALNVGENAESTGRYWTGDIDEVRLYNRALSAAEVLQLYRAGSR